jgi:hypothetical protein
LKKKSLLKNMQFTSVDLCKQGANPDSDIKLFKSADHLKGGEEDMDDEKLFAKIGKAIAKVLKQTKEKETVNVNNRVDTYTEAFQKSIMSIIGDTTIDAEAKAELMEKSLEEFTETVGNEIGTWSIAKAVEEDELEDDEIDEENLEDEYEDDEETPPAKKKNQIKKGVDIMAELDMNKLSAEDKATIEAIKKKYGTEKEEEKKEETLNPEVKKALDDAAEARKELDEIKKSMEIANLETIAKKYEILGKDPKELGKKLYELKKAGGTAYDDAIALYDEMVAMTNTSGIFKELGTGRTGADRKDLDATVSEIMKSAPTLTRAEAIVKAYETNPNLSEF